MREEKYQSKMPDIMEAIFDAGYLIFDLVAAILFFTYAKGNTLFILYGILTYFIFHLCKRKNINSLRRRCISFST